MGTTVAIAGASGYAGGELLRLVAGAPGPRRRRRHRPRQRRAAGRRGAPAAALGRRPGVRRDRPRGALAGADLVFLALPHGASAALRGRSCRRTQRIVDLGADHRLADPAAYAALLRRRARRRLDVRAARAARPARAIAASRPGREHRLLRGRRHPRARAADRRRARRARTTWSWSPRAARPAPAGPPQAHLLGSEVMGDLSRVQGRRAPARAGDQAGQPARRTLSMTPVLAPMPRGILATVTARPAATGRPRRRARRARRRLRRRAVRARAAGRAAAAHRGHARLQRAPTCRRRVDADSGRIVVTSAIDNLGKGAAGQAVQNANLMLGLPETAGLSVGRGRAVSVTAPQGFRAAGVAAGLKASGAPRRRAGRQRRPARRRGRRVHRQPGQGRAGAVVAAGARGRRGCARSCSTPAAPTPAPARPASPTPTRTAEHVADGARHRRRRRRGLLHRPDRRAAADGRSCWPASTRRPPR